MEEAPHNSSPSWSSTTKLLVGLVMIGIFAFLLVHFQSLISPLLLILIISYLFHPLAALIANSLNISWKAAVGILYLSIFISVLGLITVGGIGDNPANTVNPDDELYDLSPLLRQGATQFRFDPQLTPLDVDPPDCLFMLGKAP